MYTNDHYPLAVMLTLMQDALPPLGYSLTPSQPESMAILMAGCVMFVMPMVILYMVMQRWFVESVVRVGITG